MAGARRRLAMAGIDLLAADVLADAAARGEGGSAFDVAGRVKGLAGLPALLDAVRPHVLIVGSPDGMTLPDVCARFLDEQADGRVVVLVTPTLALAVLYPGGLKLERPTPREILTALACS